MAAEPYFQDLTQGTPGPAKENRVMSKILRIPVEIKLIRHSAQLLLSVLVHERAVQELCLGLSLLTEGLIEFLAIGNEGGLKAVKLRLVPEGHPRTRVKFASDENVVELTPTGLKQMQQSFLRYYRDGRAEVSDTGLQTIDSGPGTKEKYFMVQVANLTMARAASDPEPELNLRRGSAPTSAA